MGNPSSKRPGVADELRRHADGRRHRPPPTPAKVAKFVGKEDAVVFNMGYGTNSTTVPALVGRGDLIVSDELNHSSIVAGRRPRALSGPSSTTTRRRSKKY